MRIPSISTDAAYREKCRQAAEHLAKDLGTIGFEVDVRPTAGYPVVVRKGANGPGPRALFYGHYDYGAARCPSTGICHRASARIT
jgi:acetylornithine deacetylase/succinyl-diaminopimelate desuccinylase-like protein